MMANFQGHEVEFGPNKVKSGSGSQVIYTLNKLADEALKAKRFDWKKPEYPEEQMEEETQNDEDAELDLNKIEEDMSKVIF